MSVGSVLRRLGISSALLSLLFLTPVLTGCGGGEVSRSIYDRFHTGVAGVVLPAKLVAVGDVEVARPAHQVGVLVEAVGEAAADLAGVVPVGAEFRSLGVEVRPAAAAVDVEGEAVEGQQVPAAEH